MATTLSTFALATVLALAGGVSGCFFTEALPLEGKTKPKPSARPAEAPPPAPAAIAPNQLSLARRVRRLSLDLRLDLPLRTDIDLLRAEPNKYPLLVQAYLDQGSIGAALSSLHTRMWHLSAAALPDLDQMISGGDTALASALSPEVRSAIADEPALMLRYLIETRRPFAELFTAPFTITHADLLPLWDLTSDGIPWPEEPYHFAAYPNDRPAAGILSGYGLLAMMPARQVATQEARTARLLREFTCLAPDLGRAHLFNDLTPAELASEPAVLAQTRPTCLACHAHYTQTSRALRGLGAGNDFAAWLTYTPGPEPASGFYAGAPFASADEAFTLMGADPRTHGCEVQRLFEALAQRPLVKSDANTFAAAARAFADSGTQLPAAVRPIVASEQYSIAVIDPRLKGDPLYQASGVRLLRRAQWQGLARTLAPGDNLDVPPALDPGADEAAADATMVPSGSYWHYANRLARQLATAIVATELDDTATTTGRRVLKLLPEGSGAGADAATIRQQLKDVWQMVTADDLDDQSPVLAALLKLWADSLPTADPDSVRQSWRVVLVAIFTHPAFLTY